MFIEQPPQFIRLLYPKALWRMDKNERAVYLTFDDGPSSLKASFHAVTNFWITIIIATKVHKAMMPLLTSFSLTASYACITLSITSIGSRFIRFKCGNPLYCIINGIEPCPLVKQLVLLCPELCIKVNYYLQPFTVRHFQIRRNDGA